ncbi:MAG: hypothetical protein C5B51_30640 [Terriglobia bacterium]|nr:MAG: hypothetical protein C5B51_30640 [Terriglobia bacterium]
MSQSGPDSALPPGSPRAARFFVGVLWNWLGVAINIAIGLMLSPYMVRKLGSERYGIWALVFTLVEYLSFFDLGFSTAVVKFVAHYRARKEPDEINRVINTGLLYFVFAAALFAAAAVAVAAYAGALFQISNEGYRQDFRFLIVITGIGWGIAFPFQFFTGCLDAFQRYDHLTRAWIATLLIRAVSCAVLLYFGFGLKALGTMVVLGQIAGNVLAMLLFRSMFPAMRLSPSFVSLPLVREMMRYGMHSFLANVSNLFINQAPPVIIGHQRPAAFVGYFTLPLRLLQYSVDGVARLGFVTRSNVAEMQAQGDERKAYHLGIYLNRYCVALFAPLVIFLLVYGRELVRLWISPEFALYSAPLLPVLSIATLLAVAGQFNSGAVLYGLGRHSRMARGLFVEGILAAVLVWIVLPRYGILGAAWVTAAAMVFNRGLYVSWITCQALHAPYFAYLRGIYLRPLLTAVPVLLLDYALKLWGLRGETWSELLLIGVLTAVAYLVPALFTCASPEHRRLIVLWLRDHGR